MSRSTYVIYLCEKSWHMSDKLCVNHFYAQQKLFHGPLAFREHVLLNCPSHKQKEVVAGMRTSLVHICIYAGYYLQCLTLQLSSPFPVENGYLIINVTYDENDAICKKACWYCNFSNCFTLTKNRKFTIQYK